MNLNPSVLSTLIALGGALIVGVAALGQWRWNAVKTWREMAEANAAMVTTLKGELMQVRSDSERAAAQARSDNEKVVVALQSQLAQASSENELLLTRMDSLEKAVAWVERQNHLLQNELDRHGIELARQENRNTGQHPERGGEGPHG